jgi:acyl-CoA reductase-like NAD-dependent aldehyde dehydrogenase
LRELDRGHALTSGVGAATRYRNEYEAVAIANDMQYGLPAYVQSASEEKAAAVAARLEAGVVFLNGAGAAHMRSDLFDLARPT